MGRGMVVESDSYEGPLQTCPPACPSHPSLLHTKTSPHKKPKKCTYPAKIHLDKPFNITGVHSRLVHQAVHHTRACCTDTRWTPEAGGDDDDDDWV